MAVFDIAMHISARVRQVLAQSIIMSSLAMISQAGRAGGAHTAHFHRHRGIAHHEVGTHLALP
jgi:hypothetical protein